MKKVIAKTITMREIKFRAWDPKKGKFEFLDVIHAHTVITSLPIPSMGLWNDLKEFLQYTGLKDKNGKEICEGDIINGEYGIGLVEWDKTTCSYKYTFSLDADQLWLYAKTCEVLGNIHQNPKLLTNQ